MKMIFTFMHVFSTAAFRRILSCILRETNQTGKYDFFSY